MEISEASKVFIRRKKSIQYVWIDTQAGSGRELLSSILMVVWIIFMGYFFHVSFGQSFWYAWFTVHIWYISGSSHMCISISWPRWILPKRHLSSLALISITPLWPPRKLSALVWSRRSPDFGNEKHVVWAGLSLLAIIALLFMPWSFCQLRMNLWMLYLGVGGWWVVVGEYASCLKPRWALNEPKVAKFLQGNEPG